MKKLTKAGLGIGALVTVLLGFEGMKNVGYRDIAGIPTNCGGHTGPDVIVGKYYPDEVCEQLMQKDSYKAWEAVDRRVRGEMTLYQWVALASWTYNFGEGALKSSTMLRLANEGDWVGACNELPKWNKADDPTRPGKNLVVSRGLITRRAQERLLCLGYVFDEEYSPNHRPLMSPR